MQPRESCADRAAGVKLGTRVARNIAEDLHELEFDFVFIAARHRGSVGQGPVAKMNMVHTFARLMNDPNAMAVWISKRLDQSALCRGGPNIGFVRRLTRRHLACSRPGLLLASEPMYPFHAVGEFFDPNDRLALVLVELKKKLGEQGTSGKHRRVENLAA